MNTLNCCVFHGGGIDSIGPGPSKHPNTDTYQFGNINQTDTFIHSISASGSSMTFCLGEATCNKAPITVDDTAGPIDSGSSIAIDILANDSDSDGSLSLNSVMIGTPPINGTAVVNSNSGLITYTHDGSMTTSDSFTYTVEDNEGEISNVATVTITINEAFIPNKAPIAENDVAGPIDIADTIIINVLANDNDSDGSLSLSSVMIDTPPVNGTAQVDSTTGLITYSHNGSSTTSDSFTYTVEDNEGAVSNLATVSVIINSDIDTGGNLIAHWLLDEGTGTTVADDTGNGNDGSLINGPVWIGNELLFDGMNDYVNVGTVDVSGGALTMTGWAQSDSLENCSYRDCRILSKTTGTATRLRFRLKAGGSTSTLIASSGDLSNGELFHVAAAYMMVLQCVYTKMELKWDVEQKQERLTPIMQWKPGLEGTLLLQILVLGMVQLQMSGFIKKH